MNQYIYLKGKLAGPVEMEEPVEPDPSVYNFTREDDWVVFKGDEYSSDLYHYEENLQIYREYLEAFPR